MLCQYNWGYMITSLYQIFLFYFSIMFSLYFITKINLASFIAKVKLGFYISFTFESFYFLNNCANNSWEISTLEVIY